jgi:ubiquitin C-terminal hydrolase
VSGTPSVQDCVREYTKNEILGKGDEWFCSACKKHMRASKKFDLWKMPDILLIHLKRFNYSRAWRDKIDSPVHIPVELLDLSEFCVDPVAKASSVYDLYAVSHHFGSLSGGHYTAFCRNLDDGKWYNLDDSRASSSSPKEATSSSAYVLFYCKKTVLTKHGAVLPLGHNPTGVSPRDVPRYALSQAASAAAS